MIRIITLLQRIDSILISLTQIVTQTRKPLMYRESYPPEQDFCDLCGCSGDVIMLEDEGYVICQVCLKISYFEDDTDGQ